MVRAPCCEKMGLKKGPWTPEEDQILINYIQLHGHGNWRALPKQAGLLRCGKSCRLRWTNYLRPDIKRGNFTREEEDTIINLHEKLGNKWSAIAARLPGRTDNEIKNVWHTHLKKRLKPNHGGGSNNNNNINLRQLIDSSKDIKKEEPAQSSSEVSTVTTSENNSNAFTVNAEANEHVSEIDENFWSEVLSADNSNVAAGGDYFPSCAPPPLTTALESVNEYVSDVVYENEANMDFWYNLFTRAEDLPGISEF